MELLPQQQHIVNQALEHKNLQVLALAGCGKTTVALEVAKALYHVHGKKTLILSYGTELTSDTNKRVTKLRMRKYCTVRTIHSAMGFYSTPRRTARTDLHLQQIIDENNPLTPVDFDVFIMDETQDLTPLLHTCICRLLHSTLQVNQRVQVIILGDILQRIFGFRFARCDYLMYPQPHFFNLPFEQCRLSVNFRSSKKILDWVNHQFDPRRLENVPKYREWYLQNRDIILAAWGVGLEPCAQAVRDQDLYPEVREVYLKHAFDPDMVPVVLEELKEHREQQHKQSDICFIANSTTCGPLAKLSLSLGKYQNFYFASADSKGDPKLGRNKCVMSTICNMKGREADHVKVFAPGAYWENISLEQQTLLARCVNEDGQVIYDPSDNYNSAYTACTRARKSMTVFWGGLKPSYLPDGQEFKEEQKVSPSKPQKFTVHQLCAFASECYEPLQLDNICTQECIQWSGNATPYFHNTENRMFPGRCLYDRPTEENYAPVLGNAVEYAMAHSMQLLLPSISERLLDIHNQLMAHYGCDCQSCGDAPCGLNKVKFLEFSEVLRAADASAITWDHLLQLAVYSYSSGSNVPPQMCRQLVGTQYINKGLLDICRERGVQMLTTIADSQPLLYQKSLSKSTPLGVVTGEADFVVEPTFTVVEVKVTGEITTEHVTQALLYTALGNNFGQPCYIVAPNLNQMIRVTPLAGITASYLLEHAIRRKLGL